MTEPMNKASDPNSPDAPSNRVFILDAVYGVGLVHNVRQSWHLLRQLQQANEELRKRYSLEVGDDGRDDTASDPGSGTG